MFYSPNIFILVPAKKVILQAGMGKIYLKPFGGLANRILSLASGMQLSKDLNKKLIIKWDKHKELFAGFNDLFEMSELEVHENDLYHLPAIKRSISIFPIQKNRIYNIWSICGILPYQDAFFRDFFTNKDFVQDSGLHAYYEKTRQKFQEYLINHPVHQNIYIAACQQFWDVSKTIHLIKAQNDILVEVDKIYQSTSPMIGLHIRRGDHQLSIQYSPLERFCETIENELKKNPDTIFYLATDSVEVEKKLIAKYNIVVHQKVFSRKKTKGVKDAYIDMLALSKTQKIYGSYWSTFSYLASEIGNTPLEIVI